MKWIKIPGRGNSICKGPEAGRHVHLGGTVSKLLWLGFSEKGEAAQDESGTDSAQIKQVWESHAKKVLPQGLLEGCVK